MPKDRVLFFEGVTTVINNRIRPIGTNNGIEIWEIGSDESDKILIRIGVEDNCTKLISCTCRHHSVKDVTNSGFCSALLAVLFYKMANIRRRLEWGLKKRQSAGVKA